MAEDKVLWTFVDANAPNEKKRIRTTTTSLACEACSKKVQSFMICFFSPFLLFVFFADPFFIL
jgi:hypothetical protein